LCKSFVGSIGTSASLVGHYSNNGIHLWVHFVDSREVCVDYFPAGKFLVPNTFRKFKSTVTP
jgi:hypothetical protein